jgi:hypothetical protein
MALACSALGKDSLYGFVPKLTNVYSKCSVLSFGHQIIPKRENSLPVIFAEMPGIFQVKDELEIVQCRIKIAQ